MPRQSQKPRTKRAYAMQLGSKFMLLNMVRMRYPRPSEPSRLVTVKELDGTQVLKLLLRDPVYDREVPDFLSTAAAELTPEQKAELRSEFYASCNMLPPALSRWSKDSRVAAGCAKNKTMVTATRQRLRELATLKVLAKPDGKNWNTRFYALAQDCVFVFRNLFHPRRVDYVNWALLRNFGLDWERPTKYAARRVLPLRVRLAAQLALRRQQFTGRPKLNKQV